MGSGRWAVVTCAALPAELPDIVPALQSRLMSGLMVPMSEPGPEARLAVIQQLAAARDVPLPEPVARLLAEGLDGTVRELSGAILELMSALETSPADSNGAEIAAKNRGRKQPVNSRRAGLDADLARRYLAQRNRGRGPTLHEIALATAKHFSLRLADLRSAVRRARW